MSTPEERLAELLRQQAETVQPAGDGLSRIQRRVAGRRRNRWLLLPSAANWTIVQVTSINNVGQIAALAMHDGISRAVILTPVSQ